MQNFTKQFWNIQWAYRYQYWLEICGQTWLVSLRIRSATDQQQFMNRSTLSIAVCLCQISSLCVCQLTDQQRRCLIIANRDAVWSSEISNLQRRIQLGIYIGKHELPASLQEAHTIVLISWLHAGAITNQHLRNFCGNCSLLPASRWVLLRATWNLVARLRFLCACSQPT